MGNSLSGDITRLTPFSGAKIPRCLLKNPAFGQAQTVPLFPEGQRDAR